MSFDKIIQDSVEFSQNFSVFLEAFDERVKNYCNKVSRSESELKSLEDDLGGAYSEIESHKRRLADYLNQARKIISDRMVECRNCAGRGFVQEIDEDPELKTRAVRRNCPICEGNASSIISEEGREIVVYIADSIQEVLTRLDEQWERVSTFVSKLIEIGCNNSSL
jgi:DNA repair exonuclease SbcCD ATPase subunit